MSTEAQKRASAKFANDFEERHIIEFDTGLKDKNDKEIPIGDIVSEHQGDFIGEIVQKPSGEYRIAWVGILDGKLTDKGRKMLERLNTKYGRSEE